MSAKGRTRGRAWLALIVTMVLGVVMMPSAAAAEAPVIDSAAAGTITIAENEAATKETLDLKNAVVVWCSCVSSGETSTTCEMHLLPDDIEGAVERDITEVQEYALPVPFTGGSGIAFWVVMGVVIVGAGSFAAMHIPRR